MAAVNSIKTKSFGNDKQILVAPELAFTMGCIVKDQKGTIEPNAEGRTILPAGIPVGGADLIANRQAVLTVNSEEPQGVLLHDVDVTDGQANATLVLQGIIDLEKVEEPAKNMLFGAVQAQKLNSIKVILGSKM